MSETKSEKHIAYDSYFKMWVIEYWLEHSELSSDQISEIFHVGAENVKKWRKIYLEQGENALSEKRRGKEKHEKRKVPSTPLS